MEGDLPPVLERLYSLIEPALPWLTAIGIAMVVISLLAIPWLLIIMPRDYFVARRRNPDYRGPLGWTLWVLRNLVGLVLVIAGLILMMLPGQGLLTVLIGISVSTFPGKYRLERWLVRQPGVYNGINWIRARRDRPPLYYPVPRGEDTENEA